MFGIYINIEVCEGETIRNFISTDSEVQGDGGLDA